MPTVLQGATNQAQPGQDGPVPGHLLSLRETPEEEIQGLLDLAFSFLEVLEREVKKVPTLRGKVVACAFFEPSTRTMKSFDLAARYLSADVTTLTGEVSSVAKGESLEDTARALRQMGADCLVIRHPLSGAAHFLARRVDLPVINAGDGRHEHPTQGLLDLLTLRERWGDFRGRKVAIVGDVLHSRVARSDIWGLTKLGAEVCLFGPPTLLPERPELLGLPGRVRVARSLPEALEGADAVIALRLQRERQKRGLLPSLEEYASFWGLRKEILDRWCPEAFLLHPGPVNRGLELDGEAMEAPRSLVEEQVRRGVAVRMAVLYRVLAGRAGSSG
mgnify:CR=1 FL=1